MFEAPDPEADTPKCAHHIRWQTQPSFAGRPRDTSDMTADTPDTATFSAWPLVVSICVSAVAYFTVCVVLAKNHENSVREI
jgi:hypothetical protein